MWGEVGRTRVCYGVFPETFIAALPREYGMGRDGLYSS